MATYYLIKKKTHAFLTQELNISYPLKDSRSVLFSKFPSESLNPSRKFLKCLIIFTFYPYSLSYIFLILFEEKLKERFFNKYTFSNHDNNKFFYCYKKVFILMNIWMNGKNSMKHYLKKKIFTVT